MEGLVPGALRGNPHLGACSAPRVDVKAQIEIGVVLIGDITSPLELFLCRIVCRQRGVRVSKHDHFHALILLKLLPAILSDLEGENLLLKAVANCP